MGRKGRRRKGRRTATKSSLQKQQDAPGLLREALRKLRRNNTGHAIRFARRAMEAASFPEQKRAAEQVLSEARFQAALGSSSLHRRLEHLEAALRQTPDEARLHVYHGITLWQKGRSAEAVEAFERAAAYKRHPPELSYLRRLTQLVSHRPVEDAGLSAVERDTLHLVADLIEGTPSLFLYTLLQKLWPGRDKTAWKAFIQMSASEVSAPADLLKQAQKRISREPIRNVLSYYQGIAALREGKLDEALVYWREADDLSQPWMERNLVIAVREKVFQHAREQQWTAVIESERLLPAAVEDRFVGETIGLAYYHLGYNAARTSHWKTAIQHWRKANERIPSRKLLQNLALAEEMAGNWVEAAEAWRAMARRRPRKATHPDYLSDELVAVIWRHAADCYEKAEVTEEMLTCLKNAGKYAENDTEIRLKRVDTLMLEDREEAARNELERMLEDNPDHVETLVRLASLYEKRWNRDAMPLWRRVFALQPYRTEARDAIAMDYLGRSRPSSPDFGYLFDTEKQLLDRINLIRQGLEELPDHPGLLVRLGLLYEQAGKDEQAGTALLQAYRSAPADIRIVESVLHEMLHLDAGDIIEELLPAIRHIKGLLPEFWIDQGKRVFECELGEFWAMRFFEEAESLLGLPYVEASKASMLLEMFEVVCDADAYEMADTYEQRIHDEVPDSGAPEYLKAYHLLTEDMDLRSALLWLRKSKRAALRARDTAMLNLAGDIERFLRTGPESVFELLDDDYYDDV